MRDTIRLAVVGLGRVAHSHIDAIRHWDERCELAAVVDVDETRARSASERYDVSYYTDTEEAYADSEIDAVVICVPHYLHEPLAIEAIEAGNHVLVEKVMATSVEEGQRMVEAARTNDVNLMIGQSRRFFPSLREAKDRIDEIGTPINLQYTFACHFDIETAPDWWQHEDRTGGLVYPMLGAHSIDYTLWMLSDREPVAVYAEGATNNETFEGDDDATIVIEFDDGTHATNFLSINNAPSVHRGLVVGSEGSISWDQHGDHSGDLVGVASTDLMINGEPLSLEGEKPHNFALQMREFVDSIKEGRKPEASGEEIITQLRIIDAARRSAGERRIMELEG
ncbi:Gfo/Idh/MocA family oxidoreductase [Natronomonas sp. F2-12]|jgi:predicted dehydrogenase|uniref:Gfo/Idh/MocA family oxidoreductase n=1 Tax=Natronomonas aquatica TaxID=2841590 RepID=A0A9R1CVJ8_9EURY|nr:Gfo/Idh/MocA family oxidoreductase [Natronomonas aquatica]MCQ4334655.1 Gfo/Idh/MocA family oxidoreductase [Natronomonas aquatica]